MLKIPFTEAKTLFNGSPTCSIRHDWWDNELRIGTISVENDIIKLADNHVGGIVYNDDDRFYVKDDGSVVMKSHEDGNCVVKIFR